MSFKIEMLLFLLLLVTINFVSNSHINSTEACLVKKVANGISECENSTTEVPPRRNGINKTNPVDITKFTLEQMCQLFGIPEMVCKCPGIPGNLCQVHQAKEKTPVLVVRCKGLTGARSIISISVTTISIVGNILVMMVTKYRWKSSRLCSKLVGALALSDFLFSIFVLASELPQLWVCQWIYGNTMCKLLYPAVNMTATMALGFILIISIERYFGIVHPFHGILNSKKVYIMVAGNVVFSCLIVLPALVVLEINDASTCEEKWTNRAYSTVYSWFLLFVTFVIPVVCISTLYIGMVRSLQASQKHTRKTFSANQRSQRRHEDNRITIIIAALLISFVIMVFPNRVIWVLLDHHVFEGVSEDDHRLIKLLGFVPYLFHAALNPIIYSVVDGKFRNTLKIILLKKKAGRRVALKKMASQSVSSSRNRNSSTNQLELSNI